MSTHIDSHGAKHGQAEALGLPCNAGPHLSEKNLVGAQLVLKSNRIGQGKASQAYPATPPGGAKHAGNAVAV